MMDEEQTVNYALAYLKIEKHNLEKLVMENEVSQNKELMELSKKRIVQIDQEMIAYRKFLRTQRFINAD